MLQQTPTHLRRYREIMPRRTEPISRGTAYILHNDDLRKYDSATLMIRESGRECQYYEARWINQPLKVVQSRTMKGKFVLQSMKNEDRLNPTLPVMVEIISIR